MKFLTDVVTLCACLTVSFPGTALAQGQELKKTDFTKEKNDESSSTSLLKSSFSKSMQKAEEGIQLTSYPFGKSKSLSQRMKDLRKNVKVVKKGSSNKKAREISRNVLPLDRMKPADRKEVEKLLKNTSFFRESETLKIEVDPRAYLYFVWNPEMTVEIWKAMGISKFRMKPTSKRNYRAETGDGSSGTLRTLYRGQYHNVVLGEGVYKNPLLPKAIRARALIHLQTQFTRNKEGKTFATHRVFMHVVFPSSAVETVSKILEPLSKAIADQNFRDISLFVYLMSQSMEKQPGWIEHLAKSIEDVPQKKKEQFLKIAAQAYLAANKKTVRQAMQSGSRKPTRNVH